MTDAVDCARGRWSSIDPHYVEILLRATLSAQIALMEPDLPESRDPSAAWRSTVSPRRSTRSPSRSRSPTTEPARSSSPGSQSTTEVSQAELARLLGVSPRQFQRWLSPTEKAGPEGDDLRRVRGVARIVNQLRFSLTPAGVIEWFSHRLPQLGRKRPIDLLDRPERLPRSDRARERDTRDDVHVICFSQTPTTGLRSVRRSRRRRRPGRFHRGDEAEPTQYLCLHPLGPHAEAMRFFDTRTVDEARALDLRTWAVGVPDDGSRRDPDTPTRGSPTTRPRARTSPTRCARPATRGAIVPSAALPGTRNVVLFGGRVTAP